MSDEKLYRIWPLDGAGWCWKSNCPGENAIDALQREAERSPALAPGRYLVALAVEYGNGGSVHSQAGVFTLERQTPPPPPEIIVTRQSL